MAENETRNQRAKMERNQEHNITPYLPECHEYHSLYAYKLGEWVAPGKEVSSSMVECHQAGEGKKNAHVLKDDENELRRFPSPLGPQHRVGYRHSDRGDRP